jgi:hypothetical protein
MGFPRNPHTSSTEPGRVDRGQSIHMMIRCDERAQHNDPARHRLHEFGMGNAAEVDRFPLPHVHGVL